MNVFFCVACFAFRRCITSLKSTLRLMADRATSQIPTRISRIKQPKRNKPRLADDLELMYNKHLKTMKASFAVKHKPSCYGFLGHPLLWTWQRSLILSCRRKESSRSISNYQMIKEGGEVYFRSIDLQREEGMLLLSGSYAQICSQTVPRDRLAANCPSCLSVAWS